MISIVHAAGLLCASWLPTLQGGIIVNTTGNYYPAIRVTGMTAGQTVSLDDIEVSSVCSSCRSFATQSPVLTRLLGLYRSKPGAVNAPTATSLQCVNGELTNHVLHAVHPHVQVFTITQADAQSSLQQVRTGVPVGEQIAPPGAATTRRKARRLQGQDDGPWAPQPDLPDENTELMKRLEKDLQVTLRTGQHATSALAGVQVKGMKHVHHDQTPHDDGMHHQK